MTDVTLMSLLRLPLLLPLLLLPGENQNYIHHASTLATAALAAAAAAAAAAVAAAPAAAALG